MVRRPGSQPVPRPQTSRAPLRDPGRRMAKVRRLAKPPIVACDHPECRGQLRPWLAEPRAGRSPIHLAEYRQFPIRRSDFEKDGDSTVSGRLGENAPANRSLLFVWARPVRFLAPPASCLGRCDRCARKWGRPLQVREQRPHSRQMSVATRTKMPAPPWHGGHSPAVWAFETPVLHIVFAERVDFQNILRQMLAPCGV